MAVSMVLNEVLFDVNGGSEVRRCHKRCTYLYLLIYTNYFLVFSFCILSSVLLVKCYLQLYVNRIESAQLTLCVCENVVFQLGVKCLKGLDDTSRTTPPLLFALHPLPRPHVQFQFSRDAYCPRYLSHVEWVIQRGLLSKFRKQKSFSFMFCVIMVLLQYLCKLNAHKLVTRTTCWG